MSAVQGTGLQRYQCSTWALTCCAGTALTHATGSHHAQQCFRAGLSAACLGVALGGTDPLPAQEQVFTVRELILLALCTFCMLNFSTELPALSLCSYRVGMNGRTRKVSAGTVERGYLHWYK